MFKMLFFFFSHTLYIKFTIRLSNFAPHSLATQIPAPHSSASHNHLPHRLFDVSHSHAPHSLTSLCVKLYKMCLSVKYD